MKARLLLATAALLAGCASQPSGPIEPTMDTGTITGEAGDPRNRAKLHTELGSLYYSRGSMGVALEELRIAITADSSYAPAHGMLAVVYQELRENQLAEQSFERALKLAPNDPDINHNYGWFLCQTKREQASMAYFQQAIRNPLYPMPWRSYSAAGQCSMRTKNVKDAEDYFQRALRLEPDELASLLYMGQIRYQQGNIADARKLVSRYNKLITPTAESLWLALRIERKGGERVAETGYATQLRRRFPGSPEYEALQRGQFD
jgi:type IV pilus assembly protein PilF